MFLASLDDRLVEHVLHGARQGLGPVEDGQDGLVNSRPRSRSRAGR